ncbi:DUF2019 domain-containing protein [Methyloceanibacter caenitepidi]|nr:DUF2019 domain-containing protein [Methyloceanibacter caenitepidi]
MTRIDLKKLTLEELVERFVALSLAEEDAVLYGDSSDYYNQLFRKEQAVVGELRSRPQDARRVLTTLYNHDSQWVRMNAAKNTLALAPDQALRVLQAIEASKLQPYAGHAGMTLWTLEEGIFKPT